MQSGDEALRQSFLAQLNRARIGAGQGPVELHPVLSEVAQWRAAVVASTGTTATEVKTINEMTRRIRRQRYIPFHWTQSVMIGGGDDAIERLRVLNPEWYEKATVGEYEHAGVGLAWREGLALEGRQPVLSLVLAVRKNTVEWRMAAPLADLDRVAADMLKAVNKARAEKGRPPVELHPQLSMAAQAHAEDMLRRVYYDHSSPEGETVGGRVRDAGYRRRRSVGENIAKGLFSSEEVVERWLNSSGHRRNILREKATQMGVGVAFGDNANGFEVLWVQVFADGR